MPDHLLDRIYGCLIAGAIGDALGAPAEGLYYQQIRERYGRIDDLMPYDNVAYSAGHVGAVTDDTTLKHYICLAIVRKGGRITPDDAAQVWLNDLNPERFWSPDQIAYLKLKAGVSPWEAGRGNIPSACATMAMVPVGIINAGNPQQAYQDGYCIAGVNGDDFNREAPATLAAGVAAALAPDASVESVLAAMTQHSAPLVRRAIDLTLNLAQKSGGIGDFTERFYIELLDWWSRPKLDWRIDHLPQGTSIETVPVVMALFHLCAGDVNQCLVEGANFGRDADAIASLAGALAGGLHGASSVRRQDWIAIVEQANRDFFEEVEGDPNANFHVMAQRLVNALRQERQNTQQRLMLLDKLLQPATST